MGDNTRGTVTVTTARSGSGDVVVSVAPTQEDRAVESSAVLGNSAALAGKAKRKGKNSGSNYDDPWTDGASFRVVGVVIAFIQLPVAVFLLMLYAKKDGFWETSWWVVFSPLLAMSLILFLISTKRSTAPHSVRFIWVFGIVNLVAFIILLVFKLEYNSDMLANVLYIYVPWWILSGGVFVIGLLSCVRAFIKGCGVHPSLIEMHLRVGIAMIAFSILMTVIITIMYLKQSGSLNAGWTVIFIPWWIIDTFAFLMGVFLIVFSWGAGQDALFPLFQVLNFQALVISFTVFEVLLALFLDGEDGLPIYAPFIVALVVDLLFVTCGAALIFGKNRQRSLFAHKKRSKVARRKPPAKRGTYQSVPDTTGTTLPATDEVRIPIPETQEIKPTTITSNV
ncbi:hypothetical protein Pelo_11784 [Pelomyxa schiedti]|nr:hypothetical protein Pelo_11784 [Pelomyxa schiedti]